MKKILTIAAIAAVGVYGAMCISNEMRVNDYVSATAAYVEGACNNGAITEKDCVNLTGSLSYCWFHHCVARKMRAERVRELVDAAYEVQREKQSYRIDYVSNRMK